MKKLYAFCLMTYALCVFGANAADDKFVSCGVGFILADGGKVDGISISECQKLWCRDLENGKPMGANTKATTGYKATVAPVELCDAQNNCIQCFGDRKWCAKDVVGVWNPEFGAYTRRGDDNNTYKSSQKGDCFGWQLEKPDCPNDQTAILQGDEWICATNNDSAEGTRASSVRRTGSFRRR